MLSDKEIEMRRYDERAKLVLSQNVKNALAADGAKSVLLPLRAPYLAFESIIREHSRIGIRVLDLCGGTGLHSLTAARLGAEVTVTDIAPHNLELASLRAKNAGLKIKTVVADADSLPFPERSFEVVTCAGSLSYINHARLIVQLERILIPGGAFLFVDSLNHNPIYQLNRYFGYLRGRRSRGTLLKMPDMQLLDTFRAVFPDLTVSYHGIFSFMSPILSLFISQRPTARLLDKIDAAAPPWLQKMSFKIVVVGHLPKTTNCDSQKNIY